MAAIIIFLLLGKTIIFSASKLLNALMKSSVEGFIVWLPETITSTPSALNCSIIPAPCATATIAYFLCSFLACDSRSSSDIFSLCWRAMFSHLIVRNSPYFRILWRTIPGSFVWTWTLTTSSSFNATIESPWISSSFKSEMIWSTLKLSTSTLADWSLKMNSVQYPNWSVSSLVNAPKSISAGASALELSSLVSSASIFSPSRNLTKPFTM